MEHIVETTRRQNAASAQLPKTKLSGLDRLTAGPHSVITDLPEIVVVSVPDLSQYDAGLSNEPSTPPTPSTTATQSPATTPIAQSPTTQRRSMPGVRESASHSPLSRPHAGGLLEKGEANRTSSDTSFQRPLDGNTEAMALPQDASPAPVSKPAESNDLASSAAPPVAAADSNERVNTAANETQTRIDSAQATSETTSEPAWKRAIMPMRNRFFSGLLPRRSSDTPTTSPTPDAASDSINSDSPTPNTEAFDSEAALNEASMLSHQTQAFPSSTLVDGELEPTTSDQSSIAVDSMIDAPYSSELESSAEIESSSAQTENASEISMEAVSISPSASELRARELDARERHGRTIARQLFEHPAVSHSSSLLLVATGGVRRAIDAVECIGRGIAWHLDRDVELISIESHAEEIWNDLPEAHSDEARVEALSGLARVMRSQTTKRLSTIELATEKNPTARRLSSTQLQKLVLDAKSEGRCLTWLIDGSETAWCESLGAICDATVMLVDLQSSRVDESRWVVTHLRDHGARLVGSLVVNAYEEQP